MSKLTHEKWSGDGYGSQATRAEIVQKLGLIEHKSETLIEQACELCHLPYTMTDQAALEEKCKTCPLTYLEKIINGEYPEAI